MTELDEEIAKLSTNDSIYGMLSNFEIDKKIGKGQFSIVYRAKCKLDGKLVALKKVQVQLQFFSLLVLFKTNLYVYDLKLPIIFYLDI